MTTLRRFRFWLDRHAPRWLVRLRLRIGAEPIVLAILIVLILLVSQL